MCGHLSTGLTLPGYRYLGPGNSLDRGDPTNASDAAARRHDYSCSAYKLHGKNPYIYFNKADERFIKETDQATDWGGKLGNWFFRGKRYLAPRLDEPDFGGGSGPKRPRKNPPPRHVFINLARKRGRGGGAKKGPGAKKPRTEDTMDGGESQDQGAAQQPDPAATLGAGGGGGGGGGRGGGVGHSTGSFDNRTTWEYLPGGWVEITCWSSRLIHQKMPQNELYKTVVHKTRGNGFNVMGSGHKDDAHVQVVTPWNFLDCNAWGVWFSPADFQHLVNTCDELHIVSLEQEIFNVVLKTVTEVGPADSRVKQYANDLTASLLVAEDSNNIMPFTPAAMRQATIGFWPWRPTNIPVYAYYSDWTADVRPTSVQGTKRDRQGREKPMVIEGVLQPGEMLQAQGEIGGRPPDPREPERPPDPRETAVYFKQNLTNPQFFTIENQLPIDLVRTGDSWATGKYIFDCKPMMLYRQWQTMRQMGMPPHGITLPSTTEQDLTMPTVQQRRGRAWGGTDQNNYLGLWEANMMRPTTTGYMCPEWFYLPTAGGPAVANGPLGFRVVGGNQFWDNGINTTVYGTEHGSHNGVGRQTETSFVRGGAPFYKQSAWVQKNLTQQNQINQGEFLGSEINVTGGGSAARQELGRWMPFTTNTYSPYTAYPDPGHSYPWGQIWDKVPDYELKPRIQPTAPFCTPNPPGQIFTRIAPNLTEEFNPDSATYSRIVTFCDYWWKGKLVFKAKLRVPSQFNLHQFFNLPYSNTEQDYARYLPNALGQIGLPHIRTKILPKKSY